MNRYHATVAVDQRLSGIEGCESLRRKLYSEHLESWSWGGESFDIVLIYVNVTIKLGSFMRNIFFLKLDITIEGFNSERREPIIRELY